MIDKGIQEAVEMLLADANGQRSLRLIVVEEVERDVQRVIDGSQMETTIGGRVSNAYAKKGRAVTTITLTARHSDGRIGIGVGTCDAHKPSPGRCWLSMKGVAEHWKPKTCQGRIDR